MPTSVLTDVTITKIRRTKLAIESREDEHGFARLFIGDEMVGDFINDHEYPTSVEVIHFELSDGRCGAVVSENIPTTTVVHMKITQLERDSIGVKRSRDHKGFQRIFITEKEDSDKWIALGWPTRRLRYPETVDTLTMTIKCLETNQSTTQTIANHTVPFHVLCNGVVDVPGFGLCKAVKYHSGTTVIHNGTRMARVHLNDVLIPDYAFRTEFSLGSLYSNAHHDFPLNTFDGMEEGGEFSLTIGPKKNWRPCNSKNSDDRNLYESLKDLKVGSTLKLA